MLVRIVQLQPIQKTIGRTNIVSNNVIKSVNYKVEMPHVIQLRKIHFPITRTKLRNVKYVPVSKIINAKLQHIRTFCESSHELEVHLGGKQAKLAIGKYINNITTN